MSNSLRITLIAEGKTDKVIIEAALNAILTKTFILTLLQPEETKPALGQGWGGVLKWCQQFVEMNPNSTTRALDTDPTLADFDLIIIHLDAFVAEKSYADLSMARQEHWQTLPCSAPCPPPTQTIQNIQALLLSWLQVATLGNKSVSCIPSKSSEAWLTAAVLPANHALHTGLECHLTLETALKQLPIKERIKKGQREYYPHAPTITANWATVTTLCSQAAIFHQNIAVKQL